MSFEEFDYLMAEARVKSSLGFIRLNELCLQLSKSTYESHVQEAARKRRAWERAKAETQSTHVEIEWLKKENAMEKRTQSGLRKGRESVKPTTAMGGEAAKKYIAACLKDAEQILDARWGPGFARHNPLLQFKVAGWLRIESRRPRVGGKPAR